MIVGNLVTTIPLGLMMIQGGAACDNAKKYVEKENLEGPGTKLHEATIVGDPLKDATDPSFDVLMNLIGSIVVLFAASFINFALL